MNLNKNKNGTEIISIWELFILLIIAGGIVIGVILFYSASVDVRESEVSLFYEKLAICLNQDGNLNEKFLEEDFDIYSSCKINRKVLDKEGDYFFEVSLIEISEAQINIKLIEGGNNGHKVDCQVISGSDLDSKEFALCLERKEYVNYNVNGEDKEGYILIKTGSNQRGGKIPIA